MSRKLAPHSIESERGVIGSILLDNEGMRVVESILKNYMFYILENKIIYEAFEFLYSEGKPIDILTVHTYLNDRDLLSQIGGNTYIIELTESIFTSANIEQYAKTVRSKYLRRQLISAGATIQEIGKDEDSDIDELFDSVENTTKKLFSLMPSTTHLSIEEGVSVYQETLLDNYGKTLFGWSWGDNLQFLDKLTRGVRRKKIYRIGALSGAGKTQLGAYNLIPNLLKQGAKVAFFTLENDMSTTINNILANMQGVNNDELMDGSIAPDLNLLFPYKDKLSIIEKVTDLHKIMKIVSNTKPDVVILDYIGYVTIKGFPAEKMYAEYAKLLPPFVNEHNLSWIDLSNLKMGFEDEPMKIVVSGQYYGASELKNNIDVGIHIINNKDFVAFRDKLVEMDGEEGADAIPYKAVDVWVTKNRGGKEMMRRTYIYQWNKGGRMREATKEERDNWKNGFIHLTS